MQTEEELCSVCQQHLIEAGYVIYPEVEGIDLLGQKDGKLIAFEAKLKFNLKLLAQAASREGLVDRIVLVVSDNCFHRCSRRNIKDLYLRICSLLGYGLLYIQSSYFIRWLLEPLEKPRNNDKLLEILRTQAENHTKAGRRSCRKWTKWSALEVDYVNWLETQPKKSALLDAAIRAVEPKCVGKRGKVLQQPKDSRAFLILKGRWRLLKIQNDIISIKEEANG